MFYEKKIVIIYDELRSVIMGIMRALKVVTTYKHFKEI